MVMVVSGEGTRRVVLDEEALRQRILSLGASWQTAQYALIKHVAELDAVGGWAGQGFSRINGTADSLAPFKPCAP